MLGTTTTRDTGLYVVAQVDRRLPRRRSLANLMFELPAVELSTTGPVVGRRCGCPRSSPPSTLLLVIQGCVRTGRANVVPFAVGAWIGGAYWFTSSTSFANPAVTVARTLSDTFAGIAPASAPMFIVMQLVGAVIAFGLVRFFYPRDDPETADAVTPPDPRSCSSASTTPAAPRWPRRCSPTTPATGSSSAPAAPRPPTTINPAVVEAMAEIGIDLRAAAPTPSPRRRRGRRRPTWSSPWAAATPARSTPASATRTGQLDDPAGQGVDAVRPIRDEIDRRVRDLVAELAPADADNEEEIS